MSRVVVSLSGGLGNQLFQYATARALVDRTGAELILDLTWFNIVDGLPNTTKRNFALAPFALHPYKTNARQFSLSHFGRVGHFIQRWLDQLRSKAKKDGGYYEHGYGFDPDFVSIQCPVHLHGHWQSYHYFQSIAEILREEIGTIGETSQFTRHLYEQIKKTDSICVHIRRGDYVTNSAAADTHGLCELQYYLSGLEQVSSALINPHCYVFSDDPDWVRKNFFIPFPMTIVDVNGPDDVHQDLWLMAACKKFVIANSTLSWWGAWLSDHPAKAVVAPSRWFLSGDYDTKDLIPESWIRI